MANLIPEKPPVVPDMPESKIVTCESCGQVGPTHRMVQILLAMGSPGHEDIPPLQCRAEPHPGIGGHFSCPNRTCYLDVLWACANEHLLPQMEAAHAALAVKGLPNNGN